MSSNVEVRSGGIGLCGMVFIVFLILKLAEIGAVASWSWWWVTAPLWGPFVLVLGIVAVIFLFAGIAALLGAAFDRKRRNRRR